MRSVLHARALCALEAVAVLRFALLALMLLPSLAAASEAELVIRGFAYAPDPLEVDPGARVSVVNRDAAPHSATAQGTFDSGVLGRDETAVFSAPSTPGTYPYICSVHGASMGGTLVVRNASAPADPTPAATPTPAEPTPAATPTPTDPTPVAPTPVEPTPPATAPTPTPVEAPTTSPPEAADATEPTRPAPGLPLLALLATLAALARARRR